MKPRIAGASDPPELAELDDDGGGGTVAVGGLANLVVASEEAEEGVICSFLIARFCAEVMERVVGVFCTLRNFVAAARNMVAMVAIERKGWGRWIEPENIE